MRYVDGRRKDSSPSPSGDSHEEARCRSDDLPVCHCRVRSGFRTCRDRAGRYGSGDDRRDAVACPQDVEAHAQSESPRDAQEGCAVTHGFGQKFRALLRQGYMH